MYVIEARIPCDAPGFSAGSDQKGKLFPAANPLIPLLYGLYDAFVIQYHFLKFLLEKDMRLCLEV